MYSNLITLTKAVLITFHIIMFLCQVAAIYVLIRLGLELRYF